MTIDDTDLLARWVNELAEPDPDPHVVAACEALAEQRGWNPTDAYQALVGANVFQRAKRLVAWNPDLHPRGADGKFIETGGDVRLSGGIDSERTGGWHEVTGIRGKVDEIIPDPADQGNPTIRVRVRDDKGREGTIDVKPRNVEAAPEKARIDDPQPDARPAQIEAVMRDAVEQEARRRTPRRADGQPPFVGEAIVAANPLSKLRRLVAFDPDLHPRGKDGKFIESGGTVKLSGPANTRGGQGWNVYQGQRGKVEKIIPDPDQPGNPTIRVRLTGRDGRTGTVDVKPMNVEAAPEKARLDRPGREGDVGPSGQPVGTGRNREQERAAMRRSSMSQRIDEQEDDVGLSGQPEGTGRNLAQERAAMNRPPETPEQRERREAASRARTLPDEELARQAGEGPDAWRAAVEREQQNRADRRAADDARRQQLIAKVNEQAAGLSTTDPDERAAGLDEILAGLRFSIIDTDKVHDHIYPPGESGRWTPERTAQHEEIWNDLLAQVEAAGVPQDKDAFVLGGLPGAGKSYTLRPGQKAAGFGIVAWEPNTPIPEGATHVSVNPDIVKEMLIARGMLPEGISSDLKPMEQVTFLHEESSAVAKMLSARLGKLGYNVVLDNTMDSEGGMLKRMTPLARQGYSFRGLFVDIPVDESRASAAKRYRDAALSPQGGRFVPSSVQGNRASSKGNLSKNRDAMDSLVEQDWFKDWMIVDNTGISTRTPKGDVTGQGTGGGTAADRYLPGNDAAVPKQGPNIPTAPEPAPTIDVGALP